MNLEGKVVLVTGASSGIGLAASRLLAERGAHVILAARSYETLLREATLLGAHALHLDVTENVTQAVADAHALYGRIDVLINNAGNGGQLGALLDQPAEQAKDLFGVHVLGMERMTRAVLPLMLRQGFGRVLNVASTVGYVPMPGAAAYSAAKAGVIAFSRALRSELEGTPVEVALYSPPHTQTEAGKAWPLELPKRFSPEFAAGELVRALETDRLEVVGGGNASLLLLQRLSPALANGIMRGIGLKALAKVNAKRATAL